MQATIAAIGGTTFLVLLVKNLYQARRDGRIATRREAGRQR